MPCQSCQATLPRGAKFCIECGAAAPSVCTGCGFTNLAQAAFCAECGVRLVAARRDNVNPAHAQPSPAADPQLVPSVERRQLTVLFCDLVGSTPLSSRLDPEELRDVIAVFYTCVADTVAQFGGHVSRYMGDGALIFFGYPHAFEDNAARAVRGALALVSNVAELRRPYRAPECADRYFDGPGSRRRHRERWRSEGADRARGHAQPRRATSGGRRTRHHCYCRQHQAARRKLVRVSRPRRVDAEGLRRACSRLAGRRGRTISASLQRA